MFDSFEATTDKIEAFPPGLRMTTGNPFLRTPPATGGRLITDLSDGVPQPVQWTCPRSNTANPLYPVNSNGLNGVGIQDPGNGGSGVGFPDQNCDGYASPLRADLHFPSCYNPAAGLDNYKTNMQFPTNGNCPPGWIHTPHLFYEVYWNTPLFAGLWTPNQGTQPFVLSMGDPTGYGLHGDFLAGWDVTTLQQIIDNCDAGDSGMDKCSGLIGGLNDPSTSCNIPSAINEQVLGVMDALPGDNPVGKWGVNVVPGGGSTATTAAAPPASSSTPPQSSTDAPGGGSNSNPTSSVGQVVTVPVSTVANGVDPTPSTTEAATTAAPTLTQGGGSNTLVTSYVSETTVVWTTVTISGDAPTSTGSSSDVAAGWSYSGCFSDTRTGTRVLSGITFANVGQHAVTNTKCVAYCENAGFSMAGTEYGGQCFCGNELVGSSSIDDSSCDMPCEGDSSQTCGGSLALSVYTTGAKKSKSKPKRFAKHFHRHLNDGSL
jgi:hypothetical protein